MSLTANIKTIVNTLFPEATYMLSSWFKANRASYDLSEMTIDKPLIILNNELPKDKEVQKNASVLAGTSIIMQFLVKGDIYQTDEEMNEAIEALEVYADRTMLQIYQLDSIRLKGTEVQQYRIIPKFKIYNSVLVGVEATGRFKESQIRSFCSVLGVTADSDTVTADSDTVDTSGGGL